MTNGTSKEIFENKIMIVKKAIDELMCNKQMLEIKNSFAIANHNRRMMSSLFLLLSEVDEVDPIIEEIIAVLLKNTEKNLKKNCCAYTNDPFIKAGAERVSMFINALVPDERD